MFSIRQNQLMFALIYLTRWNLLATTIASALAAYFVTKHYCRKKLHNSNTMTLSMKIYWFIYNNVPIYAVWITLIYWTLLYDGRQINVNNLLTHGTNVVGPILDLFIVNHPYHITQSIFPMICSVLYCMFTIFYQLLGGLDINGKNYVYPILNWKEKPFFALTIAGSAVVCAGFFHIVFCGLQHLRTKIHEIIMVDKQKTNDHALKLIATETA